MSRDWSKEPYRKLLLRPSSSFRALSVFAQAIFYVLVREADDDGRIAFDAEWAKGVVRVHRLLGVPPRERKRVADRLEELLADGCLEHAGTSLLIPNLAAINLRRDRRPTDAGEPRLSRDRDATETRLSRDWAATEPRLSRDWAATEPRLSRDMTTTDTRPSHENDATSGNDSGDVRSRARLQVGREVGREGGSDTPPPSAPPKLLPKRPQDAQAIADELRSRADLFGSADLDAIAATFEVTLEREIVADRIDRRQVGRELVADAVAYAAKFRAADADQRVAQLGKKLAWIMREVLQGKWRPAPQEKAAQQSQAGQITKADEEKILADHRRARERSAQ